MSKPLRVTIWNEYVHEQLVPEVKEIYPQGMHAVWKKAIETQLGSAVTVRVATLDEPEHGLTQEVLDNTDVLTWWGHAAHDRVSDEVVSRVQKRVWQGMGLVALHSAHNSKPFKTLMGTSCMLRWREAAEKERVWFVDPSHPILEGFTEEGFELPETEMYGEFFDIPQPDELFTISWFEGGEVFRSGCTWRRGKGRIVYFSPGHETFPIYHNANVQRIIANSVKYAAPAGCVYYGEGRNIPVSLSPIAAVHVVNQDLHKAK